MSGSATRRSSLAFGRVVRIAPCLMRDAAMLVNIASRWALVRLNLRPDFWWRMVLVPECLFSTAASRCSAHHAVRGDSRGRPVFELHAERKAALGKHFLDLSERLLAEVRRLEQLDFGLLDQIADVVDALGLEAVGRTHGELEVVDRTQQDRVDTAAGGLRRTAVAVGK